MKKNRRWFWRVVVLALALVVLAVVAVQIILWTDLPRQIVVSQIREATGLDVQIDEMTTGWSGQSLIKGMRLRLPNHAEPFLTIDTARIDHSGLLAIAFTQGVALDTLEADGLNLVVQQNQLDEWNIEQAALLATGSSSSAADSGSADPLAALRKLRLTHLNVKVIAADGRSTQVEGIHLWADSVGPAAMKFKLGSSDKQEVIAGRLVMRGGYSHQVTVDLSQVRRWAGDWSDELPSPFEGHAIWTGSIIDGELRGQVQLDQSLVGQYQVDGLITVHAGQIDSLKLSPQNLRLAMAGNADEEITIREGTVELRKGILSGTRLHVAGFAVRAVINGDYDLAAQTGKLSANWSSQLLQGLSHRGSMTGTFARSIHGLEAQLNLLESGSIDRVTWDSGLSLRATGQDWTRLKWELRATEGAITVATPESESASLRIPLAGLLMRGRLAWPRIDLDHAEHQFDGQFEGSGWFTADTGEWHLKLQGREVDPFQTLGQSLDVRVALNGLSDHIEVTSANISGPQFRAQAQGKYQFGDVDNPLSLTIAGDAWHGLADETGIVSGEPLADLPAADIDDPPIATPLAEDDQADSAKDTAPAFAGTAQFNGLLVGSPQAARYDLRGQIKAHRLRAQSRPIDPVTLTLHSTLEEGVLTLDSDSFNMLEGSVKVEGSWHLANRDVRLKAAMKKIQLDQWISLIDPTVVIRGKGEVDLQAQIPIDDPNRAVVEGSFTIGDFEYNGSTFDQMTGRLRTRRRGIIELNPLRIRRDDGTIDGQLVLNLIDGYQVSGTLKCDKWAVAIPSDDLVALLSGQVDLKQADLLAGTNRGHFEMAANLSRKDAKLGTAHLEGEWDDDQAHVRMKPSPLLGGSAQGQAHIQLGDWMKSSGDLTWSGIAPSRLELWSELVSDIKGSTKGSLKFGPAQSVKAFEPLRFDLVIEADDKLTYQHLDWGPLKATVYGGAKRWVMDEFELKAADGTLRVWASMTQHADGWHDHVHTEVDQFDLNSLARLLGRDPGAAPDGTADLPGLISAKLDFFGKIGDWSGHTGSGRIRLSKTNLQNTDIFGSILGAIGVKQNDPTGSGFIDLRIKSGGVDIDRFVYRNGSTEVLLTGRIGDLQNGTGASVRGEAIASLRPLRDLNLTALEDLDRLLRAFQSNVTAFTIDGTINEQKVSQSRLADVEAWIDRFIRQR